MGSKLGLKMTLNLLAVALITIILVGILTNYALDTQFNRYLLRVEDQQNMALVEAVEQLYAETRSWPTVAVGMSHATMLTNRTIQVKDLQGNTLLDTATMRRGMMRHRNPINPPIPANETAHTTVADVTYQGEVVALARVTSLIAQKGIYSREDLLFRTTINRSIVTAGILGVILAVMVSIFVSNRLTKPLRNLTNAAREMGQGNLNDLVETRGDDEIAELGAAFNEMATNLNQLESLRKKLTADVAHELRTPLTTIQGYIQGMIDGVIDQNKENMESIEEEVLNLTRLVRDLQELATSQAPIQKRAPLDLKELLREVSSRLQPLFAEKELNLKLDLADSVVVLGSASLGRVFYNILTNAIKHTSKGGEVLVRLYTETGNAHVEIKDNGVGISSEDLPFIFERFYRADPSRARKTGGSGIGLTIAQEIARAHGGQIRVWSTPNVGSTFVVTLPSQS